MQVHRTRNSVLMISLFIIAFTNSDEKVCEKDICHKDGVNIYPDLNGLEQDDPKLIETLKNHILLKPAK